ncbi:MAG: DUF1269 domain-containing protein [Burkholderiales bacterium]|nr:DUF1269 domain-containing protein [Burkholderiales bacterium]
MRRRLYFLVPNVEVAGKVVDELLLARVEERHIHVLAKRGTPLGDLPEASFLQKSDFLPAVERAIPLGGATGTLAGLVALALEPGIVVAGGAVLLVSALAGAGVGAWLGGMVGMNVGNTRLRAFEGAIERGELLMMVDVPLERVGEISGRIKKHHPEAQPEGTEPTVPPFP